MTIGWPSESDALAASTTTPPATYWLEDGSYAAAVSGLALKGGRIHRAALPDGRRVKVDHGAVRGRWRLVCEAHEPDVRCQYYTDQLGMVPCPAQATSLGLGDPANGWRLYVCAEHENALSSRWARSLPLIRDPLPVSLLCGALAGSRDTEMTDLLEQWLGGDDSARAILLDLAEERGLDGSGVWPVVAGEWLEATGHEHVWLPTGRRPIATAERQCTCGVFEREANMAMRVYRVRTPLEGSRQYLGRWVSPSERCTDCGAPMLAATSQYRAECSDRACQRRREERSYAEFLLQRHRRRP